jgi:dTDP-4-dehydrorhamnose 3,5-epimerase-like enzyme
MKNDRKTSVTVPRIVIPKGHVDDRGWLSETFHEQRLREIGITSRFVQDNSHTLTLEDDVIVMYKVSDYFAPTLDSSIRWNDPELV